MSDLPVGDPAREVNTLHDLTAEILVDPGVTAFFVRICDGDPDGADSDVVDLVAQLWGRSGVDEGGLNVSVALFAGSLPVHTVDVQTPVPALEGFDIGGTRFPSGTEITSVVVRYQDRRGREYSASSTAPGRWDYALLTRSEGGSEVVEEWLIRSQRLPWDS